MWSIVPDGGARRVILSEVSDPEPRPADVLLRVEAFALNQSDVLRLAASGSVWRPGMDVVGRVVRPAAAGGGPAEGERVLAVSPAGGGAAQLVAVATSDLTVVPEAVPTQALAALPIAGLTALRLLRSVGPGVVGRRVLVTGAGGSVGSYLVDLAAAAGGEVTAVAGAHHRERLVKLGAAAVVEKTGDAAGPFDVVFDSLGGSELEAALAAMAKGGYAAWYGASAGSAVTLDFYTMARGPRGGSLRFFAWDTGDSNAADLAELVARTADGRLRPADVEVRDWSETAQRLADLAERRVRGKAVLRVSEVVDVH
jgi:NADPH:quinone reductase